MLMDVDKWEFCSAGGCVYAPIDTNFVIREQSFCNFYWEKHGNRHMLHKSAECHLLKLIYIEWSLIKYSLKSYGFCL